MNEAVEVFLWGKRIGVASRLEGVPYAIREPADAIWMPADAMWALRYGIITA